MVFIYFKLYQIFKVEVFFPFDASFLCSVLQTLLLILGQNHKFHIVFDLGEQIIDFWKLPLVFLFSNLFSRKEVKRRTLDYPALYILV